MLLKDAAAGLILVMEQGHKEVLQAEFRAVAQRVDLLSELDSFGWLLSEHWSINKRMDPGCTNPFIDSLFETMQPFIVGGKLAGAGGGGFALVLAKDSQAAQDLRHDLALRYRGASKAVKARTRKNWIYGMI